MFLVAVSSYGQEEDQERAKSAGFDAYLVKPISLKDLENYSRSSMDVNTGAMVNVYSGLDTAIRALLFRVEGQACCACPRSFFCLRVVLFSVASPQRKRNAVTKACSSAGLYSQRG